MPQIRILKQRLRLLRVAISLGIGSVLLAALLIIAFFACYLVHADLRTLALVVFGLSLLSLVASLVLFIRDMGLSLRALQLELREYLEVQDPVARQKRQAPQ